MTWYEFATEASALSAVDAITTNVAVWMAANDPARLDITGPALRGVRASNGEIVTDGGLTLRWAVPRMTAAGTWVIPVPTAEKVAAIGPMPLADVIAGISAPTVEDPEWPSAPGEFGEGGG